jgi:Calcineurin-like phosphoesterase
MRSILRYGVLAGAAAVAFGVGGQMIGCSSAAGPVTGPASGTSGPTATSDTGSLGMAVTLPGGEHLNTVNWTVFDSTNAVVQTGAVPVGNSLTITFTVGGLNPGSYTISISGTSTDGLATCAGSAAFTITARATTNVVDLLQCNAPLSEAGSANVNAPTYACAAVATASVTPSETTVGSAVTLAATATGPNAAGFSYAWSAPSGTFSNPGAAITSFTCTTAGTIPVTISVADGALPDGAACNAALATQTLQVQCDPANCGVLTSFAWTGTVATVGESLVLTATAAGTNPSALGYTWTMSNPIGAFGATSSGVGAPGVDEAVGPSDPMQFMCTAPGTTTITVVADDGPIDAGSCPANVTTQSTTVTCNAAPNNQVSSAWVELTGPNGSNGLTGNVAVARAITEATVGGGGNPCPTITINGGAPVQMNLRAAATTSLAQRSVNTPPAKPALFPVSACEFSLPSGVTSAVVAGRSLPVPKANPTKIVVIGDTGCRLQNNNGTQSCNDPNPNSTDTPYPFAAVAALAAAQNPDLVLHVGDYAYRDNPCPAGAGYNCGGSPWGFGWDTWQADLFTPGAALLAAAPWIVTRGNHEQCNRAGQGWYRFLDPNPYDNTGVHTCDNPANDATAAGGNWNNPFLVNINASSQIVVFDTANAKPQAQTPALQTGPGTLFFTTYASELQTAANLVNASPLPFNLWSNHHPIFGYATGNPPVNPIPAFPPIMNSVFPGTYFPPPINLALHGHTHDYQAINFQTGSLPDGGTFQPAATLVSGNAGDILDTALPYPLPDAAVSSVGNPAAVSVATVGGVQQFASSDNGVPFQNPNSNTDNDYGYMVLQFNAGPPATWTSIEYRTDNTVRDVCVIQTSGQISCASWGIIPPNDAGVY